MKNAQRWKFMNTENEAWGKRRNPIILIASIMSIITALLNVFDANFNYIMVMEIIVFIAVIIIAIMEIYAYQNFISDYECEIVEYDNFVSIQFLDEYAENNVVIKFKKEDMRVDAQDGYVTISDKYNSISLFVKPDLENFIISLVNE